MAKKQKKQPKKVQHTTVETAPAPKPKFDIQNFILSGELCSKNYFLRLQ